MSSYKISPKNITVTFPDGQTFHAPKGTTVEEFIDMAALNHGDIPPVGAMLDGIKLAELARPITQDSALQPIDYTHPDGARIYRRTLSFVLSVAARIEFPRYTLSIQHSLPWGGFYCEWEDGEPMTDEQRTTIKSRMEEIIDNDATIRRDRMPLDEVVQLCEQQGDKEKAELFQMRDKNYLPIYELEGYQDYFHGFMLSSTGYLYYFDFVPYGNGAVLQFPRRSVPTELQEFEEQDRVIEMFDEYAEWLQLVGVQNVATLNRIIKNPQRLQEVVMVAEALHTRQLANIAKQVAEQQQVRIVLISGPTSSGKTTFAKRLAIHLISCGLRPVTLGLDNYFLPLSAVPLNKQGEPDYEHFDALDIDLFHMHIDALLAGEEITQPIYDFEQGVRNWGYDLVLEPDHVLLIEGNHALNPALMEDVAEEVTFKVFVSALTQLNLDKHNRIPTTDVRLLRRIVQAHAHGISAETTIKRWKDVKLNENLWVLPYQEDADIFFNSALVYEVAELKPLAEPLLSCVPEDAPEQLEANRLRAFLQWFLLLPPEANSLIPGDSLLREFIGGSIMENFEPWNPYDYEDE